MFEDLMRLNAFEILVLWAAFAVSSGIGKAFVKAWKEHDDIRSGRQKSCEECKFTVVTNQYDITTKMMDEHNERVHGGNKV